MTSRHIYEVRARTSGDVGLVQVWDAIVDMDGCVYRVGYCTGWVEETAESITLIYGAHEVEYVLGQQERRRPFKDKYHFGGHASADAARLCFYEFLLDQALSYTPIRLSRFYARTTCDVVGCGSPAEMVAEVGLVDARISLCFKHATTEYLRTVFTPEGTAKVTGG